MQKFLPYLVGIVFIVFAYGQERFLPTESRWHGLPQYNSGLPNTSFVQNWGRPNSPSLWTRWQWLDIDADSSGLFVDYSHQTDADNTFGAGFLQRNTGVFLHTGGIWISPMDLHWMKALGFWLESMPLNSNEMWRMNNFWGGGNPAPWSWSPTQSGKTISLSQ